MLCKRKGAKIVEAEVCPDHIHMLVEIPPSISVSGFVGYLKGKSTLMIFERHANLKYKYGNSHISSFSQPGRLNTIITPPILLGRRTAAPHHQFTFQFQMMVMKRFHKFPVSRFITAFSDITNICVTQLDQMLNRHKCNLLSITYNFIRCS